MWHELHNEMQPQWDLSSDDGHDEIGGGSITLGMDVESDVRGRPGNNKA